MNDDAFPTLTQLFEPPDGFRGVAGVVCGYSADRDFMDAALERFTGLTAGQRAAEGLVCVALVLDSGNPQITPVAVPGMLHLPLHAERPPFLLLHAKVALLLFTADNEPTRRRLRLIVSTGNWHAGVSKIDLYWVADLGDVDSDKRKESERYQAAADLLAAWEFLSWVLTNCCKVGLDGPLQQLDALRRAVGHIKPLAEGQKPRFFDNRKRPLIDEVVERAKEAIGRRPKPDCLVIGSAFFDGGAPGDATSAYKTIKGICDGLSNAGLLTSEPALHLVVNVNESGCQGVAPAYGKLKDEGWNVWPPVRHNEPNTFLHAKFIFSAVDDGNRTAKRPWLYLGSGNITRQGFILKAGRGNLEAGVVIRTGSLSWWSDGRKRHDRNAVSSRLPLHWDAEADVTQLAFGSEFESRKSTFIAPPVSFLQWEQVEANGRLVPLPTDVDNPGAPYFVEGLNGEVLAWQNGGVPWTGERPRQVTIYWSPHRAVVPVLSPDGRVAVAHLPPRPLGELGEELDGFPAPLDADDREDSNEPEEELAEEGRPSQPAGRPHRPARGVIRTVTQLIEQIARRQTMLTRRDWKAWCSRLTQTLCRITDQDKQDICALGINLLSPLREPGFIPAFAKEDTDELRRYLAALRAIEEAWGLDAFDPVGNAR